MPTINYKPPQSPKELLKCQRARLRLPSRHWADALDYANLKLIVLQFTAVMVTAMSR